MTLPVLECPASRRGHLALVRETANAFPTPHDRCPYCGCSMADGGAPLPGEGRDLAKPRACASCWRRFHEIARETELQAGIDAGVLCDHGIALEDPCSACDDLIASFAEEVVD